MKHFTGQDSDSDGLAFERWMVENPDGFYVNVVGPRRGRLHRARCPHIYPPTPGLDLVANAKWASDDRRELEAEARARGVDLARCSDCAL